MPTTSRSHFLTRPVTNKSDFFCYQKWQQKLREEFLGLPVHSRSLGSACVIVRWSKILRPNGSGTVCPRLSLKLTRKGTVSPVWRDWRTSSSSRRSLFLQGNARETQLSSPYSPRYANVIIDGCRDIGVSTNFCLKSFSRSAASCCAATAASQRVVSRVQA